MAKTAAQRQADYRAKRPMAGPNGERRLNMWISTGATLALNRLAKRYGVTKQKMIERLIKTEDDIIFASLALDTPEWDKYFSGQ